MQTVISTLAFMGKSIEEIVSIAEKNKYVIEFSSGLPFYEKTEQVFLDAPIKKFAHNYFPAPEVPFVLNLASTNEEVRNKSVAHCIHGLELSEKVNAPFFSAHAGFCVDPKPSELGNELKKATNINREENWKLFLSSVHEVLERTKELPVDFLIENNVLARMNVYPDGTNPLLCVDGNEMLELIKSIDNPRLGLLLDTAHLKVSANVLQFSISESLRLIQSHIRCIHHSDNNGELDTNDPIGENYWFLDYLSEYTNVIHVLEVKKQSVEQINFQLNLLKNK
jgi:sugar phosphate isomerase/epimerase